MDPLGLLRLYGALVCDMPVLWTRSFCDATLGVGGEDHGEAS